MVLTPTQIRELCLQYGLSPSKKYGQNYLIQRYPIDAMIRITELQPTDVVVEIGPGFGVLTLSVASLVKRVVAFEIEQKLRGYWEQKLSEYPNVEIVWGNALDQLTQVTENLVADVGTYKVLANLPYQITSHAIRTILEAPTPPSMAVLMVQKEVAERICAKPGEMSMLAVSVQYYGTPEIVKKVARGSFFPSPKVDSAIIAIKHITSVAGADQFFVVVKAGFSSKRKYVVRNIANQLGIDHELVKKVVMTVTGNEKIRAEDLSVTQWKAVVAQLAPCLEK